MKTAVMLLSVVALPAATAHGAIVTLAGEPDFSQHANLGWSNYCAPTAGANVAYYFSSTFAGLGGPWNNNNAATTIIGGLAPGSPPPPAGSMAFLMGTTLNGGTTANGLALGLDAYLEANDGLAGNVNWNTAFLPVPAVQGGPAIFWQVLQNAINTGSGVVLTMAWQVNPGDPNYDVPENYFYDTSPGSAIGHAVTMVGYNTDAAPNQIAINDPANNGGVHAWGGETAWYNVTMNNVKNTIDINIAGTTGHIYGAVITIPAPGALALLGLGVLGGRRRRR